MRQTLRVNPRRSRSFESPSNVTCESPIVKVIAAMRRSARRSPSDMMQDLVLSNKRLGPCDASADEIEDDCEAMEEFGCAAKEQLQPVGGKPRRFGDHYNWCWRIGHKKHSPVSNDSTLRTRRTQDTVPNQRDSRERRQREEANV